MAMSTSAVTATATTAPSGSAVAAPPPPPSPPIVYPHPRGVVAHYRDIRIAPKKIKLVTDLVRRRTVEDAIIQLNLLQKKASLYLIRCIWSARSNAVHNNSLNPDNLYISEIFIGRGKIAKRMNWHGKGKIGTRHVRYSHVTVFVKEKDDTWARWERERFAATGAARFEAHQVKARQALAAEIGKKSLVADVDAVADDDDNDADDDDEEEAHNVPRKSEAMPAAAPGPRYRDGKWFKFRGGGGRRKPLGKVHRRG